MTVLSATDRPVTGCPLGVKASDAGRWATAVLAASEAESIGESSVAPADPAGGNNG
jgi:hypothetical protein